MDNKNEQKEISHNLKLGIDEAGRDLVGNY